MTIIKIGQLEEDISTFLSFAQLLLPGTSSGQKKRFSAWNFSFPAGGDVGVEIKLCIAL